MRLFESKTLKLDVICLIAFLILGIICFTNVILPVKIILFALSIIALIIFGIYYNHNYTQDAFEAQGKLDIKKGKVVSNLDTIEQIPEDAEVLE